MSHSRIGFGVGGQGGKNIRDAQHRIVYIIVDLVRVGIFWCPFPVIVEINRIQILAGSRKCRLAGLEQRGLLVRVGGGIVFENGILYFSGGVEKRDSAYVEISVSAAAFVLGTYRQTVSGIAARAVGVADGEHAFLHVDTCRKGKISPYRPFARAVFHDFELSDPVGNVVHDAS